MLDADLGLKALIHITSDGFLNLLRVETATVGFVLDDLPDPPPIFALLQRLGGIPNAEMFRVFNMGIGFCVVAARADASRVVEIASRHGRAARPIGYVVADPRRRVWLPQRTPRRPRRLRAVARAATPPRP